jgi:anti-sigma B factor antagonist
MSHSPDSGIYAMDFEMSEPQQHGRILLLELSGRLDGRAAQLLQQRCSEIRHQGFEHLALDLSKVTFLASSGLGVFLAETEEFAEAGGSLHLVAMSSVVAAVIKLLNVDRFLSSVSTLEELKSSMSA